MSQEEQQENAKQTTQRLFAEWLDRQHVDAQLLSIDDKKRLYATFKKDLELDKTRALLQQQQQRYDAGCNCRDNLALVNEAEIDKDPDSVAFFYALLLSHQRLSDQR